MFFLQIELFKRIRFTFNKISGMINLRAERVFIENGSVNPYENLKFYEWKLRKSYEGQARREDEQKPLNVKKRLELHNETCLRK